jgi:2-methylisocitrate lyase-like PEP mutase family enzyme
MQKGLGKDTFVKSPGKRLKELIAAPEILIGVGIYDGFSARVAQAMGFKAAIVSGAGVSESSLGRPDVGLLGYEENLRATRALAACVDIPLFADIDTGYGNAVNVYFTVKGFEQAGVGGVMIEDQVWPKRCGHMDGKEVISAEEHVEKIRAAVEARKDPDFIIRARTDALGPHGLDEAIRRLNLYADAGADLLLVDAVRSLEEIQHVTRSLSKPVVVNMGLGVRARPTTPLITPKKLQEVGVAVVEYSRLLSSSALRGMFNAVAALCETFNLDEAVDRPDLAVTFAEMSSLMDLEGIRALERTFLTEKQFVAKYGRTS